MKQSHHSFLLASAALLPAMTMAQDARRPNVMLIVVDDMGYSDMGCFGGEISTPNLDALASQGVRFSQFYNSGRSCPSRAQLLTGLYAQQVGITGMGLSLTRNCVTLAEALKTSGYRTAMSGKWHLSLTKGLGTDEQQMQWLCHQSTFDGKPFAPIETYPCNRGFEEHWGTIWGVVDHFDPFSLVHNETPIYTDSIPKDFYSTDFITQKAIDMLDTLNGDTKPFFMYVAYNAPHWPLMAKPEDIAKYKGKYDDGWDSLKVRRYNRMVKMGLIDPAECPDAPNASGRLWKDETNKALQSANMEVHAAMIDCVDQGVGRIIAELKKNGQYDNTLIIFTSDNGASPENYEIGSFDRPDRTRSGEKMVHNAAVPGSETTFNYLGSGWAGAVNTPYRYWKAESFHGGTASPTFMVWPDGLKAKAGSIVSQPCHYIDVMPTLLQLTGTSYPTEHGGNAITPLPAEGRSLVPILEGDTIDDNRPMYWEHENGRSIREGQWKLTSLRNGGWQLFDMRTDLSETTNVAAEHPDVVSSLRDEWNQWAKGVGLSVTDTLSPTPKELVFHYAFDGNLDDASPNGYALQANGGPTFGDGVYGQALVLNGQKQYADMNVTGTMNPAKDQFTVATWVRDDDTTVSTSGNQENGNYFRDEIVMAQKDNAGTGRIVLYTRIENPANGGDTKYYFDNFTGNAHNKSTANAFQRGKWQHVAVVCDTHNQTVTYYVDGKVDTTVDMKKPETCSGGFRIGGHKAGKDFWHGSIDDLYLFKGLLTGDEIRKLRDNISTGIGRVETGNSLYYDRDAQQIIIPDGKPVSITVCDASGKRLLRVSGRSSLSVASLPAGLYLVSSRLSDGSRAGLKIVK